MTFAMLVNKVSPATLCPQHQQESTHDNQFQRLETDDSSQCTQLSQYSQTSLDLFSQPHSSSQGYYSMNDTAEGGKRQRNNSISSMSSEKPQPPQIQSSKYYTRYLSLPSASFPQAQSDRDVQAQCPQTIVTSNTSYEQWLSKRQESMKGITDSVISTTKDCVKEIGSVLDDLKTQMHEQLKQSSHIDDSWKKEHTSILEQQRAILSQLMQGQLQIQQELADIKQFNTEVCSRFGSLEGVVSDICEMVKQVVQQASPTLPPYCCLDCKKQVTKKELLESQQTRTPVEHNGASIQHTTDQDQQVPGDESTTFSDFITKQLSSEHKPFQFLHLNNSEENAYSRMVDQSPYTYAQINNCCTKENHHAAARILANENSSAQNNAVTLIVPMPSPCLSRKARIRPLRRNRARQRAVERSQPKASVRRSKRHYNINSDNETEGPPSPSSKRPNYGTSKSPIIIDDNVFLKSPLLKDKVPEPPSSFHKSNELERRKAFINQSMTQGSQVLMMEIASSLKEQIQKGHHASNSS